jgi:hypothetical protein
MRAKNALSTIIFIVVALTSGTSVSAQETVPDTPPELRDFRLDEPRPQPQPETQPQPSAEPTVTAPPPVVATRPETRQLEPTRRAQPQPDTASNNVPTVEIAPAEPATSEPVASEDEMLPAPQADVAPAAAEPTPAAVSTEPAFDYWQIAVGLAAIGALAAIAWFFRRRRAGPIEQTVVTAAAIEPEPAPDIVAAPVKTPVVKAAPKPKKQPDIKIDFIPEKATITFATLTIKGQLQISNEGQADAKGMELRASLISASHQQREATELFFGTSLDMTPNAMGDAKAGEKLGVALELSVPLSEMHSFPLGDQRLMVPIILATLQYRVDGQPNPLRAEMAHMIGREANPPKPKMGPLRLDLGPRSFAPLGTRPLYT